MASTWVVLIAIYCILSHTGDAADNQCPFSCTCAARESKCRNVKNLLSGPFPADVINVTIYDSTITKLEPLIFGSQLENIVIEKTTITEISSYTFSSLSFLKNLLFKEVHIGTIRPFALYNIKSPAVIEFNYSEIKRLECEAISHMPGLGRINLIQSLVDDIDSYALFDIGVREFVIKDTEITNMNTSSFCTVFNVDKFLFSRVIINSIKAGAFTNVRNINNVNIEDCTFGEVHCNAIMKLREATPGNHDNFVFTNSQLDCGCQISPLLDYARNYQNAVQDSVGCVENTPVYTHKLKVYRPLTKFKIPASCPEVDKVCRSMNDLPSACTTHADINIMTYVGQSENTSSESTTHADINIMTYVGQSANTSPECASMATYAMFAAIICHMLLQ